MLESLALLRYEDRVTTRGAARRLTTN